MNSTTWLFVSKRLGPAVAMAEAEGGRLTIELRSTDGGSTCRFFASLEDDAPSGKGCMEQHVRIAIAQLHRDWPSIAGRSRDLALRTDLAPWIGDLADGQEGWSGLGHPMVGVRGARPRPGRGGEHEAQILIQRLLSEKQQLPGEG